jgi:hypothetical protein
MSRAIVPTVKSKIYEAYNGDRFLFYVSPAMSYKGLDVEFGNKTRSIMLWQQRIEHLRAQYKLEQEARGRKDVLRNIEKEAKETLGKTTKMKAAFAGDYQDYIDGKINRRDMCRMWQQHCLPGCGLINVTFFTLNLMDDQSYYTQFSEYVPELDMRFITDYDNLA